MLHFSVKKLGIVMEFEKKFISKLGDNELALLGYYRAVKAVSEERAENLVNTAIAIAESHKKNHLAKKVARRLVDLQLARPPSEPDQPRE